MAVSADVTWVHDLLEAFGPVRLKRMFGGHGVYADDVMIAIVADATLWLKVDGASRAEFERNGSTAFVYQKKGVAAETSYWRLPDDGVDDPDRAAEYARLALDAARRARLARPRIDRRRRSVSS